MQNKAPFRWLSVMFDLKMRLLTSLIFLIGCTPSLKAVPVNFQYLSGEECWIVDHKIVRVTFTGGEFAGKTIRVPIFNGTGPEVSEEDLFKQIPQPKVGPRMGQSYCLLVPKGEVRKTVHNILSFYSQNILKGANLSKPKYLADCEIHRGYTCKKTTSMDDGTATWSNLTIDGVPDNYFQIVFPAKPGVRIIVGKFEDVPIDEDGGWQKPAADERSKKYALIKWAVR